MLRVGCQHVLLFTSYLDELSIAGECAAEYLALYQKLIKPAHWKVYLAARGVLPYIGSLITKVWTCLEELKSSRRLVPVPSVCLAFVLSNLHLFVQLLAIAVLMNFTFALSSLNRNSCSDVSPSSSRPLCKLPGT